MIDQYFSDNNTIKSTLKMIVIAIISISILYTFISSIMQPSYEQTKSLLPSSSTDNRTGSNGIALQVLNITITPGATSPMAQMALSDYFPKMDQVTVNSSVIWTNEDSVVHTVTYKNGTLTNQFDSGNINPDQTFSHTFNEQGNATYYCKLHPYMQGVIYVK